MGVNHRCEQCFLFSSVYRWRSSKQRREYGGGLVFIHRHWWTLPCNYVWAITESTFCQIKHNTRLNKLQSLSHNEYQHQLYSLPFLLPHILLPLLSGRSEVSDWSAVFRFSFVPSVVLGKLKTSELVFSLSEERSLNEHEFNHTQEQNNLWVELFFLLLL